ncbi:iron-siderophore ABC transporter substrate-binding protein [Paenibacillus sepulcri]|uniref:Iron-siderophore ABC transporter substrate-binding protein n=1 Tax=Paenibacillus sepulcri TaxID=359917 RepID=A0ABS7CCT5_9BACL|nr:iron-siderophore ABC transporter substrate-binding protein [Paenibacillus sepulcri]
MIYTLFDNDYQYQIKGIIELRTGNRQSNIRIWNSRGKAAYGSILLLMLAVMLAACGSGNTNQTSGGQPSSGTSGAQEQTGSAAPADSAAAADKPAESALKTVQHVYGESEIPSHPERIVSIGLEDMLLSLEVPLVQANGMEGYYLSEQLQKQNIPVIYAGGALNYEAILAAQPDLIIAANGFADQAAYEKLSQIAPTIAYDRDQWKISIVEIGKALDRDDKAKAVIQAYDDKLKQARETIVQAVGTDKTVALVRPSQKEAQLFFPDFAYGSVLYNDLGLAPASSVVDLQKTTKDTWGISLSLEKLPELTADYLFITAGGSLSLADDFQKAMDTITEVENLQVWKAIPAVKQNHVYKLSARYWMLSGPIADSMKIDDVTAAVRGKQ